MHLRQVENMCHGCTLLILLHLPGDSGSSTSTISVAIPIHNFNLNNHLRPTLLKELIDFGDVHEVHKTMVLW